MASEAEQHASDGLDEPRLRVVLDLMVADPAALTGTVALADGSFRRKFHGWIDLMSAINTLRAGADGEARASG